MKLCLYLGLVVVAVPNTCMFFEFVAGQIPLPMPAPLPGAFPVPLQPPLSAGKGAEALDYSALMSREMEKDSFERVAPTEYMRAAAYTEKFKRIFTNDSFIGDVKNFSYYDDDPDSETDDPLSKA